VLDVLSDGMEVFLIFLYASIGNKALKHILGRNELTRRIFSTDCIVIHIIRRRGDGGRCFHKVWLKKYHKSKSKFK
jgi:hypothetical protein